MTTTLEELLKKHPKAVKQINNAGRLLIPAMGAVQAANCIHLYAAARGIGSPLDSVADLLAAIEAHITASEPLSDEAIEAMKWNCKRDCKLTEVGTLWLKESHNADIDRLHAEIRRLRKGDA